MMRRLAAVSAFVCCLVIMWAFAGVAAAYDRDAAVTWAQNTWNSIDPNVFGGYIPGADCTNYASSALEVGGIQRDAQGSSGWWCYRVSSKPPGWIRSNKWVNANEQRLYSWSKSGVSEVGGGYNWYGLYNKTVPTNQIAMVRGDIVSINWNRSQDEVSDHAEFGVGYGTSLPQGEGFSTYTGDLINQHTSARHQAIWHCRDRMSKTDLRYTIFRVWHLSNSFNN